MRKPTYRLIRKKGMLKLRKTTYTKKGKKLSYRNI